MPSNFDDFPGTLREAIDAFENNIHYAVMDEHSSQARLWEHRHRGGKYVTGRPIEPVSDADAALAQDESSKRVGWLRDVIAKFILPFAKELGLDPQPYADFMYCFERGDPGTAAGDGSEGILIRNSRRMLLEAATEMDSPIQAGAFLVAELAKEINVSPATLSKYAKAAGVTTPRRGQRNHRYSDQDRSRILSEIVTASSDSQLVTRCKQLQATENRAETEIKPKARN